MSQKAVYMEYTRIPIARTLSDIQSLLVGTGAVSINQEYKDKRVSAFHFVLPVYGGRVAYRLPCRIENLPSRLKGNSDAAEKIAWRQVYRWLEAQLAFAASGLAKQTEVLMPYALDKNGQTAFDAWEAQASRQLPPAKQ